MGWARTTVRAAHVGRGLVDTEHSLWASGLVEQSAVVGVTIAMWVALHLRADNPEDDPNIEGGDDESEMDEMELRATDLVFLAARNEDEVGHLEVYVYEAADNVQGGNLFVHHDIMLPAFPLW